jgi:indole-3-glycerol phosphate synthase
MDILEKIVAKKQERLIAAKKALPLEKLQEQCAKRSAGRFYNALAKKGTNIIAEIKKASPSKGLICKDFEPVLIAKAYKEGGASAISVLTEEDFFQGSLEILKKVRVAVDLPILRKDFIIDPYQIYEAAFVGADAFLLIAALLETEEMIELAALGEELGLDSLVEIHTEQELEKVLNSKLKIIGVNNRNLKTFTVNLDTSINLASLMPQEAIWVSESGINTALDIEKLKKAGYKAFLVGEQLMRSSDPKMALLELLQVNKFGMTQ